jgi:hypothetical protein
MESTISKITIIKRAIFLFILSYLYWIVDKSVKRKSKKCKHLFSRDTDDEEARVQQEERPAEKV